MNAQLQELHKQLAANVKLRQTHAVLMSTILEIGRQIARSIAAQKRVNEAVENGDTVEAQKQMDLALSCLPDPKIFIKVIDAATNATAGPQPARVQVPAVSTIGTSPARGNNNPVTGSASVKPVAPAASSPSPEENKQQVAGSTPPSPDPTPESAWAKHLKRYKDYQDEINQRVDAELEKHGKRLNGLDTEIKKINEALAARNNGTALSDEHVAALANIPLAALELLAKHPASDLEGALRAGHHVTRLTRTS